MRPVAFITDFTQGLLFAGFLLGIPLLIGFTLSRLVADPFYEFVLAFDANAFALSDRSKVEGAHEIHLHEMRLRMDAAIGRAPPIREEELQARFIPCCVRPFQNLCYKEDLEGRLLIQRGLPLEAMHRSLIENQSAFHPSLKSGIFMKF